MKVLILGGSGMLGHKLWQVLSTDFDTYVTVRKSSQSYADWLLFDTAHAIDGVSADNFESVSRAIDSLQPSVVVNCIGVVKQSQLAKDPVPSITINSLFPHQLAKHCVQNSIRLIHISTDCVFSGKKGNYIEDDISDAEDLYGRTKYLGEIDYEGCLTIRTSMIGREIETSNGLIEWFFAQRGKSIQGYTRAIFSGFTTQTLSATISMVINKYPDMKGVWQIAAQAISKYDLLTMINEVYRLGIDIRPDGNVGIDRSLNGSRFQQATGFVAPSWRDMIVQMHDDPTPYDSLRRIHVKQ